MEKQYTITHDALEGYLGIMMPRLNERDRRIFAAAWGKILGPDGMEIVDGITGISQTAVARTAVSAPIMSATPKPVVRPPIWPAAVCARRVAAEKGPARQVQACWRRWTG